MTEVVREERPVVQAGCICASVPPLMPHIEIGQRIANTPAKFEAAILPWETAMALSMFGIVLARSTPEQKLYRSFLEPTHRNCPVHDAVFWPRVMEEAQGQG